MQDKELNIVYWRGLFIPIVISILILLTILVFVTTNVGEPHKMFSFNPPTILTQKL